LERISRKEPNGSGSKRQVLVGWWRSKGIQVMKGPQEIVDECFFAEFRFRFCGECRGSRKGQHPERYGNDSS